MLYLTSLRIVLSQYIYFGYLFPYIIWYLFWCFFHALHLSPLWPFVCWRHACAVALLNGYRLALKHQSVRANGGRQELLCVSRDLRHFKPIYFLLPPQRLNLMPVRSVWGFLLIELICSSGRNLLDLIKALLTCSVWPWNPCLLHEESMLTAYAAV